MVLEPPSAQVATMMADNPLGDQSTENGTATQVQRSSKVVLFNDEDHTYDYVVEMLTHCCELSREAAFYCALEVDMTGRTIVYFGDHDSCRTVCDKIISYGPDHRLPHSMSSMAAEVQEH
jgi:ATP-dependent Clp protease adaptor protein ClpS